MNSIANTLFIIGLLCLGVGILSSTGFADNFRQKDSSDYASENKTSTEQTRSEKKRNLIESGENTLKPSRLPVYTPPFLGAPVSNRLVGMAVRGIDHDNLLLTVLTPESTGITSQSQPTLYWYLSKPVSQSYQLIEFVLNAETAIAPVLRKSIESPAKSGIQKISLADDNIYLQPGVEYTWSIALVKDIEARSLDNVSSGNVKYIQSSSELQARIKQVSAEQRAFVYAESGLWYESISELIGQIEQQPLNQRLPHNLMALLEQAGLQQVAVHLHQNLLDSSSSNAGN